MRLRVLNGKHVPRVHKRFLPIGKEYYRARCFSRNPGAILSPDWDEVDCAICLKRKAWGYGRW